MPTASVDMVNKLKADADSVDAALTKMQRQVDKFGLEVSGAHVKTLRDKFDMGNQQFQKYARDAARSPAILVEEDKYKNARKVLTNIIKFVQKTGKAVAKEAADAKKEITVQAVSAAESELLVNDKKLAQALKMVARGDKGRSGPKEDGIKEYNHIHIGGNAKYNLLFQPGKKLVLGTLNFHLDSSNSSSQKNKIKQVAARGGGKITVGINGTDIVKK